VLLTVPSVVAPSGELRGKGRCDVQLAGKTVWSTPERLKQIYVYLYLYRWLYFQIIFVLDDNDDVEGVAAENPALTHSYANVGAYANERSPSATETAVSFSGRNFKPAMHMQSNAGRRNYENMPVFHRLHTK